MSKEFWVIVDDRGVVPATNAPTEQLAWFYAFRTEVVEEHYMGNLGGFRDVRRQSGYRAVKASVQV